VAVQRVVVLGRGGAGKSVTAARLGQLTGLPVIKLDTLFWSPELVPLPKGVWVELQRELAARERWIMDGDLGPYDVPCPRLARADLVLILDLPAVRCAWRALRRSRERADFWWWLLTWRYRSRPAVLRAVGACAPQATVHVLRRQSQVRELLAGAGRGP
jgi:hypothetical protein